MTPAVERAGERAAEAAAARIVERLRDLAGVAVTRTGTEVQVRGRGLSRRRIEEPALRRIGGVA